MKRYRAPKLKEGELRMYWGRVDGDSPDVILAWQGERSMKRDTNYLYYALCCDKPDLQTTPLFSKMNPSFIKELELRGYDLTTLKFSIMKKALPPAPTEASRGGE